MRFRSVCAHAIKADRTTLATASHNSRRQSTLHLLRKNGNQNSQQAIQAHLRHCARQQHRRARRCFGISRWQPGMKRHDRNLHRKTQKRRPEDALRRSVRPSSGPSADSAQGLERAVRSAPAAQDRQNRTGRKPDRSQGTPAATQRCPPSCKQRTVLPRARAPGPPQSRIRKNAGIRLNSQNKNQWIKFNAVNVPNRPVFQKQARAQSKAVPARGSSTTRQPTSAQQ